MASGFCTPIFSQNYSSIYSQNVVIFPQLLREQVSKFHFNPSLSCFTFQSLIIFLNLIFHLVIFNILTFFKKMSIRETIVENHKMGVRMTKIHQKQIFLNVLAFLGVLNNILEILFKIGL